MQDPFSQEDRPRKRSNLLLRLDSWIDSSLWSAFFEAGETWEEITIFFRRFRGARAVEGSSSSFSARR